MTRPPKKSETLELRIPHATKQAFMARCAAEGRGASETVRRLIDGHLARPRRKGLRLALAIAAVAGAGAASLPTLAAAAARAEHQALDRNSDGVVSVAELVSIDADADGVVTYAEYRRAP